MKTAFWHDANSFISARVTSISRAATTSSSCKSANDTRTLEQKKALYAEIAALLSRDPGLRKEDVLINLVEVKKENWSFGNGIAQYA